MSVASDSSVLEPVTSVTSGKAAHAQQSSLSLFRECRVVTEKTTMCKFLLMCIPTPIAVAHLSTANGFLEINVWTREGARQDKTSQ